MAYEPWYQTQSIQKDEVIRAVKTSWFISNLYKNRNTFTDNYKLEDNTNVKVTFEEIRRNNIWRELVETIIIEEVDIAEKIGFGSLRGYQTFDHPQLCAIVQRRVIEKVWADYKIKRKLIGPIRMWIMKRYAPGGAVYKRAEAEFYSLAK
jgi:hypothetical protein